MDFIQYSIRKPVTVLVGVILVVLFGLIGLSGMPYQLTPTVTEPEITVTTDWIGATPYEIERDIIEEQEKVLKGVVGLVEMESRSLTGQGRLSLTFRIGTDVDDALLRVSNKLNEVPSYPLTADKPIISATGESANPVIWMMLKNLPGNETPIDTYRTFFENDVRQYLERVEGVAELFVGGGTEREMHVVIDPAKLAAHGLTVERLMAVLAAENVSVSAGNMELGRREYRIRSIGEFHTPEEIEDMVVSSTGERRIRLRDVGHAAYGYEKRVASIMHNRKPGISIGVKPEPGANVLRLTDAVWDTVQTLNAGKLRDNGVFLDWAYDQRPYILGAIDLVKRNILIGGMLAVAVLLIFLRSLSSTVIVAVAIPISIIGSFIFMAAFGRNLNVVSLAGISFAVGMLVDNAIVVLENIDRHRRQLGKSPLAAAYDGTREVWGAVLASTLTTVAVFLPVVFMEEEAGQLFKDIAIAVTCAVSISLFVSVSVIPMLCHQLFGLSERRRARAGEGGGISRHGRLWRFFDVLGSSVSGFMMALTRAALTNRTTRALTVTSLTLFAVLAAWVFLPKMEYLPQGNRNLLINILIPPPGLSVSEKDDMGRRIFEGVGPLLDHKEWEGLPGIHNLFYVGAPSFNIFGVVSHHEQRAGELLGPMTRIVNSIPGTFGVSLQAGIFQDRLGGGRAIDLDLSGDSLEQLTAAGGALFGAISQAIPGTQIRPNPSLELTFPEVRLTPRRDRVRAAQMTAAEVGTAVDVLMDGRKIGEFKEEGKKKIDLVLKASEEDITTPEALVAAQLATPGGALVPVSSLMDLERTLGITEIRHLERRRTVTLEVTPPETLPLEQAMETLRDGIIPEIGKTGLLAGVDVRLAGAADKLTVTRQALQWNFVLAVVIIYLLMSSLFSNFLYPLVILFTVPLAAAGGFLGLRLENALVAYQPLDVVTMLGFVILIGVVVNNAILIVHQSLNNMREGGMEALDAVVESVRTRLRPIYMSAMTSIFGMLPLAVAPGPGSELYRGLGSVILGGLALSTVFTVFVIPSLFMFFVGWEKRRREMR
ncbi:HAE1 family hydrophobic/amphiphilic exporter-1 [Desulfobaculum xiamenense]|uniref:HAE1 family hydrophobic/amphiphilic exporter-1 n=1 Tax=Desulfobaculum xiamenense TaxID=995050 RepID=A0A846QUZ5_9BACT|nr:efflux RND transporter permease subunit [Desulfobaculum xiamenense]NJB68934.1 HAE1 family hydrophobic/amphiphilic exporter-1 [Desulfobaculum xiamenense]